MAFKTLFMCEYCEEKVWAFEAPEYCNCEMRKSIPSIVDEEIKRLVPPPHMPNEEKIDRYREQYRRNGFSWLGKNPKMFMGAFGEYASKELPVTHY